MEGLGGEIDPEEDVRCVIANMYEDQSSNKRLVEWLWRPIVRVILVRRIVCGIHLLFNR